MNTNHQVFCETHKVPMVPAGVTKENAQRFVCVAGGCVKEIGFGTIGNLKQGYGFINNGTPENLFFHFSELPSGFTPRLGVLVKFEVGHTDRGPVATKLEPKLL